MKKSTQLLSFLLAFVIIIALLPLCVSAETTKEENLQENQEVTLYGVQIKVYNGNLAVRFLALSNSKDYDRIGLILTIKNCYGEVLRKKIVYGNTALLEVVEKTSTKTTTLTASECDGNYFFPLIIDNLPTDGLFSIAGELFYVKNGNSIYTDTCYIELEDTVYCGGYKNGKEDFYTYLDYAEVGMERLCNEFWNESEGHFYRTHGGNIVSWTPDIWENAQSLLALVDFYEATDDDTYYEMIKSQWEYLQKNTGKSVMTGETGLNNVPYWAQDDCAWGALELMAFYRILDDEIALVWAHDLIVNTINYWGTGDLIDYNGTKIKECLDGIYYTYHETYLFQSVFGIPLAIAGMEYCMVVCPENPSSVDIYEPCYNIFMWTENHMCRTEKITYKNYDNYGSCTVTYVDNLYYVDYGRYGENGPTNARIPAYNSSTCLFSNMAMAVCAMQIYDITKDESFKNIAIRTAKAITKYETYKDSGCYITERDMSCSCSMLGYFVKNVLTLPEISLKEISTLYKSATFVGTKGNVEGTNYYYVKWNKDYLEYVGSFDDLSQNAYECQPVMASIVHLLTASALFAKISKK